MSDELRLAASALLALTATLGLVPVAIRLAVRTGFLDIPMGYKSHGHATPYLGGFAVVSAIGISLLAVGAVTSRYAPILTWALVLFVLGTVDDKRNLNPASRVLVEVVAAIGLWHYGLGWGFLPGDIPNLLLTIVWTVGLVNAFNLMDNMDGAAATVAGICAAGTAVLAIVSGNLMLAAIVLAVSGACVGFLPYNLARPSRIFLGDGGSMPLGFIVAAGLMCARSPAEGGLVALCVAAPMAALPILDTILVIISRRRGHRPMLSGGRDHVTFRLRSLVGTPRGVAVCLAAVQGLISAGAILLAQGGTAPIVLAAGGFAVVGAVVIYLFEVHVPADVSYVGEAQKHGQQQATVPASGSVAPGTLAA